MAAPAGRYAAARTRCPTHSHMEVDCTPVLRLLPRPTPARPGPCRRGVPRPAPPGSARGPRVADNARLAGSGKSREPVAHPTRSCEHVHLQSCGAAGCGRAVSVITSVCGPTTAHYGPPESTWKLPATAPRTVNQGSLQLAPRALVFEGREVRHPSPQHDDVTVGKSRHRPLVFPPSGKQKASGQAGSTTPHGELYDWSP